MNFVKLEATGNDFIVIDARSQHRNWSNLAKDMCRRRLGIGADGLILIIASSKADIGMKIFNSDGSEAEACGNGFRCLAKYVIDRNIVTGLNITIETLSGLKKIEALRERNKVNWVRVSMGIPQFQLEKIPVEIELFKKKRGKIETPVFDYILKVEGRNIALSLVSMGNPHAINFISEPVSNFPISEVGPKVENHPLFPRRTNFEIARIINRNQIEARVWERGAGETLSCGSGACAIAVISKLRGFTDNNVDIILPGGILNIEWDGVGEVWLSGPAKEVFTGEWPE